MKYICHSFFCIFVLILSITHANGMPEHITPDRKTSTLAQAQQKHFVQFFTSANATKAEGMKNTLQLNGHPAFVFIKSIKHTQPTYYQVQVGPFPSKTLAMKTKEKVVQQYPQYLFLNDAILKTNL